MKPTQTRDQLMKQLVGDQCDEIKMLRAELEAANAQIEQLKGREKANADDLYSALMLVAKIREALGDDGRRMQDELLTYCRQLVKANKE